MACNCGRRRQTVVQQGPQPSTNTTSPSVETLVADANVQNNEIVTTSTDPATGTVVAQNIQ